MGMIKIKGETLNGLCVFVANYVGALKIYQHLHSGIQVIADTEKKIVSIPHIFSETTYEDFEISEDIEMQSLTIKAVKRAPYGAVKDFVWNHEGSRRYMEEQLTKDT